MPSTRVATWLAIAAGGLIGTAAALLAHRQSPAPPRAGPAPTEPAVTESSAPARPPAEAAPADAAAEAAPAGFLTHYAPPLPAKPDAVKTAALHCAWGHIDACLQTAAAYRDGRGADAEPGQASLYERRARQLAIELCEEGDPEGCYALAHMYERGLGLPESPAKVPGLVARVRMLCHSKPTPICSRLAGGDAG